MKKRLTAVILLTLLLCLTACSQESGESSDDESKLHYQESSISDTSAESSDISVNLSSLTLPLEIDNWGSASKYNPSDNSYVSVPVKITNIVSGAFAEKEIRQFSAKNSSYTYTPPSENTEWIIAEYEFSLDGFPVQKGGVAPDITAFITSPENEPITLDGKLWATSPINISEENYFFEGTVQGKIAYQMLKGYKNYIIVLGEWNETQAFFKIK